MAVENKKFKAGDKVISIRDTSEVPEGSIGYILLQQLPPYDYTVDINGKHEYFNEDELELLRVSQDNKLRNLGLNTIEDLEEHTGGSVNYYKVHVANPTTLPEAYYAEANDIIESLGLTFAEGNLFKAVWRIAADRNGKKKKGNNPVYDAEKLVFFAERVLMQEKAKQ
jgi:hypothetical protein